MAWYDHILHGWMKEATTEHNDLDFVDVPAIDVPTQSC